MRSSPSAPTRSCTRSRSRAWAAGPAADVRRGRLDHFGLNAADEASFREIRRRIVAEGAGDGVITDLGALLSTTFTDPDGGEHEVVLVKPGVPLEASLRRTWKTIEMD